LSDLLRTREEEQFLFPHKFSLYTNVFYINFQLKSVNNYFICSKHGFSLLKNVSKFYFKNVKNALTLDKEKNSDYQLEFDYPIFSSFSFLRHLSYPFFIFISFCISSKSVPILLPILLLQKGFSSFPMGCSSRLDELSFLNI